MWTDLERCELLVTGFSMSSMTPHVRKHLSAGALFGLVRNGCPYPRLPLQQGRDCLKRCAHGGVCHVFPQIAFATRLWQTTSGRQFGAYLWHCPRSVWHADAGETRSGLPWIAAPLVQEHLWATPARQSAWTDGVSWWPLFTGPRWHRLFFLSDDSLCVVSALIMASATPFCFCTTQKHLMAKIAMNSRPYAIIPLRLFKYFLDLNQTVSFVQLFDFSSFSCKLLKWNEFISD